MGMIIVLVGAVAVIASIFYAFNRFLARSSEKNRFLTDKDVAGQNKNPYTEISPLESCLLENTRVVRPEFIENPYGLATADLTKQPGDE